MGGQKWTSTRSALYTVDCTVYIVQGIVDYIHKYSKYALCSIQVRLYIVHRFYIKFTVRFTILYTDFTHIIIQKYVDVPLYLTMHFRILNGTYPNHNKPSHIIFLN